MNYYELIQSSTEHIVFEYNKKFYWGYRLTAIDSFLKQHPDGIGFEEWLEKNFIKFKIIKS